ncbi:MAG: hypothetical protein JF625_19715 [Inquilinus limosus]|uniref:Jacalin-type lectin domain-containing protein n=1 Tax=Inquilinus limosus TaxID=171674 RepID=A0A952FLQ9_9PROT|nr:hypothetical protein [Inquilinus limosus]
MPDYIKAGPSGGVGGGAFSALGEAFFPPGSTPIRISMISIWSGIYIDAIQLEFTDAGGLTSMTPKYGGDGGALFSQRLAPNEFITSVVGTYGDYVDSLQIKTNLNIFPHLGSKGARTLEYFGTSLQKGIQIQGFWGSSGKYIDALGIFVALP